MRAKSGKQLAIKKMQKCARSHLSDINDFLLLGPFLGVLLETAGCRRRKSHFQAAPQRPLELLSPNQMCSWRVLTAAKPPRREAGSEGVQKDAGILKAYSGGVAGGHMRLLSFVSCCRHMKSKILSGRGRPCPSWDCSPAGYCRKHKQG